MFKNEEALNDVRRKVAEKMKKDGDKLIFGWRGEPEPTRKEGDEWVDVNGKKWTIKGGIRQSVTKLDSAKTPYWCPKCSKPMNHRFDIKFWRIRGHCCDCNVKFETELRRQGKWKDFEQKIMLRNYISAAKDRLQELQHYLTNLSKPEYLLMNETEKTVLMFEKWDVDLDTVRKDLTDEIELIKKNLAETIEQYGTGEDNET
jgi:ribosomal protein L37AE/L43A